MFSLTREVCISERLSEVSSGHSSEEAPVMGVERRAKSLNKEQLPDKLQQPQ
ncbi:hypothetical protein Echvi_4042 [Echinicola vietnamensis DSM 17526]|uniref:Uncharacterized protein n=1 Tax=Echinicola vietnamensis (strain DSM 17526 / LMG 23754 / KMM 6221) TaxID=926556 RepID=L0FVF0_ECHVK|nr:hypothetical protein Echvi_1016 [Echinicola vietnamensis DSM 17526]AGA78399.1 hypothetical protein Echvi_2148 [Echinicola vietnamensis DSM 17526]AGA80249.1 hypothetical protein Echvi_4042 [Echinicola vietnamensis DSM 17526]